MVQPNTCYRILAVLLGCLTVVIGSEFFDVVPPFRATESPDYAFLEEKGNQEARAITFGGDQGLMQYDKGQLRLNFEKEFFKLLGDQDRDGFEKLKELRGLMTRWIEIDTPNALVFFFESEEERDSGILSLFCDLLTRKKIDYARKIFLEDRESISDRELVILLQSYSESDPKHAMDIASQHGSKFILGVLQRWAGTDPDSAMKWVNFSTSSSIKSRFAEKILPDLFSTNEDFAKRVILENPDWLFGTTFSEAFRVFYEKSPSDALSYYEQLNDPIDRQRAAEGILESLRGSYIATDFTEVANWVEKYLPESSAIGAMQDLVGNLFLEDPVMALEELDRRFTEGSRKDMLMKSFLISSAETDPEEIFEWVEGSQLPTQILQKNFWSVWANKFPESYRSHKGE